MALSFGTFPLIVEIAERGNTTATDSCKKRRKTAWKSLIKVSSIQYVYSLYPCWKFECLG